MTDSLLVMSKKEMDRYAVFERLIRKEIKRTYAAKLLKLSGRHVSRLKKAFVKYGAEALINKQRGQPSHHRIPERERKKIARLLTDKYADFSATFAAEKLHEFHKITHDPKTIRAIQKEAGLVQETKRKTKEEHRSWRQRRSAFGEMEQFDGSYHNWFESRGGIEESCLLASIDDATGKLTDAEFAPHEGVFPVFAFWQRYLETHGKPRSIYMDKFSTYKMNSAAAQLNPDLKTQFERAMTTLTIEPIFAQSPQAKGRVERLFRTLQDRLVKELRLHNISSIVAANCFLKETFIPLFNKKFSVVPASNADMHQPLATKERILLPSVFSRQEERVVNNDFTFSFKKQWHQLTQHQPVTVCKKDTVTIEEHLDHTIHVRLRGKDLNYIVLPKRPKKTSVPFVLAQASTPIKPAAHHPWRKQFHANVLKVPS